MSAFNPIDTHCINRVKPSLLRDIKMEAILVFSRTALERYFATIDKSGIDLELTCEDETRYVYTILRELLGKLQESVVNVDYLIDVMQSANNYPLLKTLAKQEESLMRYYDIMAQQVRNHFEEEAAYLPELLVICVLEEWILGEEKSTHLYPFLDEIDFLELISVFERNRKYFEKDETCKVSEILELSFKVVEKLKNYKYKANKSRVSKTRKKKAR